MTSRGARLVLATAGLAFGAAALSFLAPSLPAGLGAACAPDLVLRELLAGLTVLVLLVAPSFQADEPGRPPECHGGLLAALSAAPAAVALASAGGLSPADLLPAAALLLACDLAASSCLRLDPSGKRGTLFAAAGAALLAGVPIAAYGIAEFGGWEGAAAAFRISPLLAVRDVGGGWGAVGPAALLLVAAAAVLRFAGILRKTPALAFLLLVPMGDATVLVVGAPREGDYAARVAEMKGGGEVVSEADALPADLPWSVRTLVFARPPRSEGERAAWTERAASFARAGGRVVPWPGLPADAFAAGLPSVAVPHPADREEAGVNPGLFRIPFPVPPRSLPGATLAFLGVLTLAMAGAVLLARRSVALGGLAAVGTALLLLPGLRGESFRSDLFVLEERVEGAAAARRVEVLRVERLRPGGTAPSTAGFGEIRFSADSGPGAWALYARVSGVESPAPPEPYLAKILIDGPAAAALADLRRSGDPRVSFAAALLAECLRPPAGTGPLLVVVPSAGPDAVVIHPR